MSEEGLGLIGPVEGKGRGRVTRRFALVFAKNELICVKIGGTLSLFTPLLSESLDVGFGLPTLSDVYDRVVNKRVGNLQNIQVPDILKLDELNFSIPYRDIEKIEVQKKSVLSPRGRMVIDIATKSKKYWFRIVEKKAFDDCVTLVKKVLPQTSQGSID